MSCNRSDSEVKFAKYRNVFVARTTCIIVNCKKRISDAVYFCTVRKGESMHEATTWQRVPASYEV